MPRQIYSPSIVQILLVLNGLSFLLLIAATGPVFESFALWPLGLTGEVLFDDIAPRFAPWQLVSYSFLHGGVFHLMLNMYALWLFGSRIEQAWGSKAFGIYYFVCVIGAGLVQLFVASQAASAKATEAIKRPIVPPVVRSGLRR